MDPFLDGAVPWDVVVVDLQVVLVQEPYGVEEAAAADWVLPLDHCFPYAGKGVEVGHRVVHQVESCGHLGVVELLVDGFHLVGG